MKGSKELIAYHDMRREALGEKATSLNMFLEGFCVGCNDTKEYMIEKAWEFIQKNFEITSMSNGGQVWYGTNGVNKNDFLKAMEE